MANAPDFVPDTTVSAPAFIPDAVVSTKQTAAPSFIADNEASPDDIQLADKLKVDQTNKANAEYENLQQKFGGPGNVLAATALGVARGGTLGTSDLALTKLGLVKPETLAGLQEANPISSGAGQLLGGAGLIGLTGGAGGLTEGAGTAAKIAGTAIEGSLFGAGNAVSDYAMGDPNLNAQKIAAHIGTGALFGAGLGALGQATKAILSPTAEALSNSVSKLKNLVGDVSETEGPITDWASKFKLGLDQGVEGKPLTVRQLTSNLQELVASGKKAAKSLYEEAAPVNISESLEDMPVMSAKNNASNVINDMNNIVQGFSLDNENIISPLSSPTSIKIVNSALNDVNNAVAKAKTTFQVHQALDAFAKEIDAKKIIKFDTLPTASQMSDQAVLRQLRDSIRGNLKDSSIWGDAANHYTQLSENYSAYKNASKNFQSAFMRTETGPNGIKRAIVDPTKVNSFMNRVSDPTQDLKKGYLNSFIDQTNTLAKASENYSGFIKGAGSISDHIEGLSKKNADLLKIAEAMSSNGSAKTGLGTQGILAMAAHTLGVPNPIIGAAIGASKAYNAISNPYLAGSDLSSTFIKLKSIGEILQKATKNIDLNSKAIFSNNSPSTFIPSAIGLSEKQYTKNSQRIQDLVNNPGTLQNHLEKTTSALFNAAPNISSGLHSTIATGLQFLYSKLPKPTNELVLNSKWEPTSSQKNQFDRYYQAVNDPIGALKQIKNGYLSNETMEALQAVHPELLKDMQTILISHMQPNKLSNLNYSTKIALSKFLQQPLESALLPQVISSNQMALSSVVQGQSQQKSINKKPSIKGLEDLHLGNRTLTRTQQLEKEPK